MTGTADRGPLDALGDGAWRVRQAAAAALARAELAEDTVHALLEGLRTGHRDLGLLNSTLQVLARTPADVTPALSACLAEADAAVRTYAAQALGDRGDPRAVPALLRALSDPDTNVRTHAIEALGKLRAGAAVDDLADLATSGDFAVAFPALDALAAIGDGRIAYRLTPLLRDPLVQEAAADALGRLGDEEAVGPLTALLDDPNAPVGAVARALAALQDGQERRYGRGRYLARLAARALTALGLANLIGAVEGAGRADAAALARVLGWAACPAADRALIRLLALPEAPAAGWCPPCWPRRCRPRMRASARRRSRPWAGSATRPGCRTCCPCWRATRSRWRPWPGRWRRRGRRRATGR
jgi:HEAT repeat protein